MEDFDGLASSLSGDVDDVRGCLILSKDGLVLAAHPESGEVEARHAWVRFAALGDPERGFAQFGAETWCFVRRGPYAGFAIVGPGVRPGIVIDTLELILLAAEESRGKPPTVREPVTTGSTPTTRPRTSLHPESRPADRPVLITTDVAVPVVAEATAPVGATHGPATTEEPTDQTQVPAPAVPSAPDLPGDPAGGPRPRDPEEPETERRSVEGEIDVDRFSLAREFGQLLQDDEAVADG